MNPNFYYGKRSRDKKKFSQKEPGKIRLLKRFLDWIARGTEKSETGKPFCPT